MAGNSRLPVVVALTTLSASFLLYKLINNRREGEEEANLKDVVAQSWSEISNDDDTKEPCPTITNDEVELPQKSTEENAAASAVIATSSNTDESDQVQQQKEDATEAEEEKVLNVTEEEMHSPALTLSGGNDVDSPTFDTYISKSVCSTTSHDKDVTEEENTCNEEGPTTTTITDNISASTTATTTSNTRTLTTATTLKKVALPNNKDTKETTQLDDGADYNQIKKYWKTQEEQCGFRVPEKATSAGEASKSALGGARSKNSSDESGGSTEKRTGEENENVEGEKDDVATAVDTAEETTVMDAAAAETKVDTKVTQEEVEVEQDLEDDAKNPIVESQQTLERTEETGAEVTDLKSDTEDLGTVEVETSSSLKSEGDADLRQEGDTCQSNPEKTQAAVVAAEKVVKEEKDEEVGAMVVEEDEEEESQLIIAAASSSDDSGGNARSDSPNEEGYVKIVRSPGGEPMSESEFLSSPIKKAKETEEAQTLSAPEGEAPISARNDESLEQPPLDVKMQEKNMTDDEKVEELSAEKDEGQNESGSVDVAKAEGSSNATTSNVGGKPQKKNNNRKKKKKKSKKK